MVKKLVNQAKEQPNNAVSNGVFRKLNSFTIKKIAQEVIAMTTVKRFTAVILSVLMVVSVIPTHVLANQNQAASFQNMSSDSFASQLIESGMYKFEILPSQIFAAQGQSTNFIAAVLNQEGDALSAVSDIDWTVSGHASSNTFIDAFGRLNIGSDESGDQLSISATWVQEGIVFGTAMVTLSDEALAFGEPFVQVDGMNVMNDAFIDRLMDDIFSSWLSADDFDSVGMNVMVDETSLIPAFSPSSTFVWENSPHNPVMSERDLRIAVGAAGSTPTVITLGRDIELTSTLSIPSDSIITLKSSVPSMRSLVATNRNFDVIIVEAGAVLALGWDSPEFGGLVVTRSRYLPQSFWEGLFRPRERSVGRGVVNRGMLIMQGGAISGNYGGFYGGGVYNRGAFYLYNGEIFDNHAVSGGAGVANRGNNARFIMYGGRIANNNAVGATADGGGVFLDDAAGVFNMYGGLIGGNSADRTGGGVSISHGSLNMYGGTISENHALNSGGVHVTGGANFVLHDGEILGNTATNRGGGVTNRDISEFYIHGGIISGNVASEGAAIFNYRGSSLVMYEGMLLDNHATGHAGGVFNLGVMGMGETSFIMNDGVIAFNTSGGEGSGINTNRASVTMNGGSIHNNHATGTNSDGGGVLVRDAVFTMQGNSRIADNTAVRHGGGVRIYNAGGSFVAHSGEISGNRIYSGHGGGISSSGVVTLNNVLVHDNYASGANSDGGGVNVFSGMFEATNTTFSGNTARRDGGGVHVSQTAGNFISHSGEFSENDAGRHGGAIFISTPAVDVALVPARPSFDNRLYVGQSVVFNNNNAGEGGSYTSQSPSEYPRWWDYYILANVWSSGFTCGMNNLDIANHRSGFRITPSRDHDFGVFVAGDVRMPRLPINVEQHAFVDDVSYVSVTLSDPSGAFNIDGDTNFELTVGQPNSSFDVIALVAEQSFEIGEPAERTHTAVIGIRATNENGNLVFERDIRVSFRFRRGAPTGIVVTPNHAEDTDPVRRGTTVNKQFYADVQGTYAYQGVIWNVEGGVPGTRIDADGRLTIAANETAETLTIVATSVVQGFEHIRGMAAVNVYGLLTEIRIVDSSSVTAPQTIADLFLEPNGTQRQLSAVISPPNARLDIPNVTWISNNPDVADIDQYTGIVTTHMPGRTTITVTTAPSERNPSISSTARIVVYTPVANVVLDYGALTIDPAQADRFLITGEGTLTASILPGCTPLLCVCDYDGNGAPCEYNGRGGFSDIYNRIIVWSSSNPNIATVESDPVNPLIGIITGAGYGEVRITATVLFGDGRYREVQSSWIRVIPGHMDFSVALNRRETTVPLGRVEDLRATIMPFSARGEAVVEWRSDDASIARVENGRIIPVSVGTTTVRVTATRGHLIHADEVRSDYVVVTVREGIPNVSLNMGTIASGATGWVVENNVIRVNSNPGVSNIPSVPFSFNVAGIIKEPTVSVNVTRNNQPFERASFNYNFNPSTGTGNITVNPVDIFVTNPSRIRDNYTVRVTITNYYGEMATATVSFQIFNQYAWAHMFPERLDINYHNLIRGVDNDNRLAARGSLNLTHEFRLGVWQVPSIPPILQLPIFSLFRRILFRPPAPPPPPPGEDPELAFVWTANDTLRWRITNPTGGGNPLNVASVQYLHGGVWRSLEPDMAVSPFTPVRVVGFEEGTATLRITHVPSGVSVDRPVNVTTLRNQLYFIRTYPAIRSTVTYTYMPVGASATAEPRTVTLQTNARGELALYKPRTEGVIVGDINFLAITPERPATPEDAYLGSINVGRLHTGTHDRFQMYPFTTVVMQNITMQRFFSYMPDGTPFEGDVSITGGLFINGRLEEGSIIGTHDGDSVIPRRATVGSGGFFYVRTSPLIVEDFGVTPADRLQYVYEVHFHPTDGSSIAPQIIRVDGFTTNNIHIRLDDAILTLQPVDWSRQGLVVTSYWFYDYERRFNVSNNRVVGPTSPNPYTELTAVLVAQSSSAEVSGLEFVESDTRIVPEHQVAEKVDYIFLTGVYEFWELVLDLKQDFDVPDEDYGMLTVGLPSEEFRSYTIRVQHGNNTLNLAMPFQIFNGIGIVIPQSIQDSMVEMLIDSIVGDVSVFGSSLSGSGAVRDIMSRMQGSMSGGLTLPGNIRLSVSVTHQNGNPLAFDVKAMISRELYPNPSHPGTVYWSRAQEGNGTAKMHVNYMCPGLGPTRRAGGEISSGPVSRATGAGIHGGFCLRCARKYAERFNKDIEKANKDYRALVNNQRYDSGWSRKAYVRVEGYYKAEIIFNPRFICQCVDCAEDCKRFTFKHKEIGVAIKAGFGLSREWRFPIKPAPPLAVAISFSMGIGGELGVRYAFYNSLGQRSEWQDALQLYFNVNAYISLRAALGVDIWIAAANTGLTFRADVGLQTALLPGRIGRDGWDSTAGRWGSQGRITWDVGWRLGPRIRIFGRRLYAQGVHPIWTWQLWNNQWAALWGNQAMFSDAIATVHLIEGERNAEGRLTGAINNSGGIVEVRLRETTAALTRPLTFNQNLTDSGSWITNLPTGMSQNATRIDARTVRITISGIPTTTLHEPVVVTVPRTSLSWATTANVRSISQVARFDTSAEGAPSAGDIMQFAQRMNAAGLISDSFSASESLLLSLDAQFGLSLCLGACDEFCIHSNNCATLFATPLEWRLMPNGDPYIVGNTDRGVAAWVSLDMDDREFEHLGSGDGELSMSEISELIGQTEIVVSRYNSGDGWSTPIRVPMSAHDASGNEANINPIAAICDETGNIVVVWQQMVVETEVIEIIHDDGSPNGRSEEMEVFNIVSSQLWYSVYSGNTWSLARSVGETNIDGVFTGYSVAINGSSVAIILEAQSEHEEEIPRVNENGEIVAGAYVTVDAIFSNIYALHIYSAGTQSRKLTQTAVTNGTGLNIYPQIVPFGHHHGFIFAYYTDDFNWTGDVIFRKLTHDGVLDDSFLQSLEAVSSIREIVPTFNFQLVSAEDGSVAVAWVGYDSVLRIEQIYAAWLVNHVEYIYEFIPGYDDYDFDYRIIGEESMLVFTAPITLDKRVSPETTSLLSLREGTLDRNGYITIWYDSITLTLDAQNENQPIETINWISQEGLVASNRFENGFDYTLFSYDDDVAPNLDLPIYVTITNTGVRAITDIDVRMGGTMVGGVHQGGEEVASWPVHIPPGGTFSGIVFARLGSDIGDLAYTITATTQVCDVNCTCQPIRRSNIFVVARPDVSFGRSVVTVSGYGQRGVLMNIFNVDGRNVPINDSHDVVVSIFRDAMLTDLVDRIVISDREEIRLINERGLSRLWTYEIRDSDLNLEGEVPDLGIRFFKEVSIVQRGTATQGYLGSAGVRIEESCYLANRSSIVLHSMLRYGQEAVTATVNNFGGEIATIAHITVTNDSFQSTSGILFAQLLDSHGHPIPGQYRELQIPALLPGESSHRDIRVEFSQVGSDVIITSELPPTTAILWGDADNSGVVDLDDINLLRRYLAGHPVTIHMPAADADGSGVVDLDDINILRRYLAGHPVTLGP